VCSKRGNFRFYYFISQIDYTHSSCISIPPGILLAVGQVVKSNQKIPTTIIWGIGLSNEDQRMSLL